MAKDRDMDRWMKRARTRGGETQTLNLPSSEEGYRLHKESRLVHADRQCWYLSRADSDNFVDLVDPAIVIWLWNTEDPSWSKPEDPDDRWGPYRFCTKCAYFPPDQGAGRRRSDPEAS